MFQVGALKQSQVPSNLKFSTQRLPSGESAMASSASVAPAGAETSEVFLHLPFPLCCFTTGSQLSQT